MLERDVFIQWRKALRVLDKPDEFEARELMRSAGLPVASQCLIPSSVPVREIKEICFTIEKEGPFVLKLCSPHVLHKTERGGVRLGIHGEDLITNIEEMRGLFPGENLLLYAMEAIRGPEFILGALNDPTFGPAVMVGAGGILTEVYQDVAFRLAPCLEQDANHMLCELILSPVLEGYRGNTMDRDGLIRIIVDFSHLARVAAEEGAQLDINPLVWNGKTWTILDAKCVFLNAE